MEASELLIEKLKEFEGFRRDAYRDAAGVLTIGYGHTGKDVREGDRLTMYGAEQLLLIDLKEHEAAVRQLHVLARRGSLMRWCRLRLTWASGDYSVRHC